MGSTECARVGLCSCVDLKQRRTLQLMDWVPEATKIAWASAVTSFFFFFKSRLDSKDRREERGKKGKPLRDCTRNICIDDDQKS